MEFRRDNSLAEIHDKVFDLVCIGGGITGCGVALDAASRGLSVALIERDDFGSGTSSKSSKLIHGGLRYLAHLEVGLVRQALTERGVVRRIGGHLVQPMPFLVPKIPPSKLLTIRTGLTAYDVLAVGSGFPRHRSVNRTETLRMAEALTPRTSGGLVYFDAVTDDSRLVATVAQTAHEHGARIINHAEVVGLESSSGRVTSAAVRDSINQTDLVVRGRSFVNATGVWSEEIAKLENSDLKSTIRPSKGVHISVDSSALSINVALLLPTTDGRFVFVIPWIDSTTIIGTTDNDYSGDLQNPRADSADVSYLLDTVNRLLDKPIGVASVISTWAGLRPLIQREGKSTRDISRRHEISVGPGSVVSVVGGKLTTYRAMAADTVDAALEAGEFPQRPKSQSLEVFIDGRAGAHAYSLPPELAHDEARLWSRYGHRISAIADILKRQPHLAEKLDEGLPYLKAEVVAAVRFEGASSIDDVLARRLRARLTSRDRGYAASQSVSEILANELGWTESHRLTELENYRASIEADIASDQAAGLGSTHR